MEFVVVDNGFLMNFKNVIFNGIDDAKLYDQRDMVYGGFRYSKEAYFQIIGNYDVKLNKMKQYTPAIVVNVFKININDALFNSLLKQKTLKVTFDFPIIIKSMFYKLIISYQSIIFKHQKGE